MTAPPAATPRQAATQPPEPAWEPTPLPEWKWRTVPVFFMFSLGGFIGLEIGIIAGAAGNSGITSAVSIVFALMFGLAFSRVMTRLLISRRIDSKPHNRRKRLDTRNRCEVRPRCAHSSSLVPRPYLVSP